MNSGVSFSWVLLLRHAADHPRPFCAEVKQWVELHLRLPFYAFMASYMVNFTLLLLFLFGEDFLET
jgi:hypothetical protein